MEILSVSCKDCITNEEQIMPLDAIRNMNSRRIYNQEV